MLHAVASSGGQHQCISCTLQRRSDKHGGGEGVQNPKVCVPKMAQINFSFSKFHIFPL